MFSDFDSSTGPNDFQDEMPDTAEVDFEKTARLKYQLPEVKRGAGIFTIVDYFCYNVDRRLNKKRAFFKLIDENGGSFVELFSIDNGVCAKLSMMLKTLIGNQLNANYDPRCLIGTKVEAFITYNFLNNGHIYANIAQWRLFREKPVVTEPTIENTVDNEDHEKSEEYDETGEVEKNA